MNLIPLLLAFVTLPMADQGDDWSTYCEAKPGCSQVYGSGTTELSNQFQLNISASTNGELSFLVWGVDPYSVPFQGGTMCVRPPLRRLLPDSSGNFVVDVYKLGSSTGWDINNTYYAQFWYRDFGHPDGTNMCLTNAIRFFIY